MTPLQHYEGICVGMHICSDCKVGVYDKEQYNEHTLPSVTIHLSRNLLLHTTYHFYIELSN